MSSVLVIEDERALRIALRTSLAARGLEVIEAGRGEEGVILVADRRPSVVLLDLGLPDLDGLDAITRIRRFSTVPIIVLTARDDTRVKVDALDAGADDFVTKPFDTDELMARVRVALRSAERSTAVETADVVAAGALRIDLVRRSVALDGLPVHLTRTELELLEALVRHPGRLLTQRHLSAQIWGDGDARDPSSLRVYVRQLRRKLGDDANDPHLILTEPGLGYRWIGSVGAPG